MARRKLTPGQDGEVCTLYLRGESIKAIAHKFGVTHSSVQYHLKKQGIALDGRRVGFPRKLNPQQEQELCHRYNNGESATVLAPEYNVTLSIVSHVLLRNGFSPRSAPEVHRRYDCDHSFFNIIDSEIKAYVLGFIAADGYISRPQRSRKQSPQVVLSLATKDRDHLLTIKECLRSNHPIRDYNYSGRPGQGKNKPYASFSIRSKELVDGLAQFGVVSAKTRLIRWPDLAQSLLRHFLRGYFDGDGCWAKVGDGTPKVAFRVTSNMPFLTACQTYLVQEAQLGNYTKLWQHRDSEGIGTMVYSGPRNVGQIFRLMYDNASIFLPRKRDKVATYVL